jgi:diamine N-acetyltransferase
VAPAAFTAAEGAYDPETWTQAIHLGDEVVGVLLVHFAAPTRPKLVRFMVGARRQGRGIGRRALALAAQHARERGARELLVSYRPGPLEPGDFYRACGFSDTGELDRG